MEDMRVCVQMRALGTGQWAREGQALCSKNPSELVRAM